MPGWTFAQGRPLGCGFLHPVLAEHTLAGGDQRGDPFCGVSLADRDQRHRFRLASGDPRGLGNAGADIFEWLMHGAVL